MPKIRIIQNCYLKEQLDECAFEPYLNSPPTNADERYLFYESDVISRLVHAGWHQQHDYFGVLSHRWERKLRESRSWALPLKNISYGALDPAALTAFVAANPDADFISLGHWVPHRVMSIAEQTHPGFIAATERILQHLNLPFDRERVSAKPIYFNYFIAKKDAIESFAKELLEPAINAAIEQEEIRALCFQNAGYFRPWRRELEQLYGISHQPLHPFIGERLINIFTASTDAKVVCFDQANHPLDHLFANAKTAYHTGRWRLRSARQRLLNGKQ